MLCWCMSQGADELKGYGTYEDNYKRNTDRQPSLPPDWLFADNNSHLSSSSRAAAAATPTIKNTTTAVFFSVTLPANWGVGNGTNANRLPEGWVDSDTIRSHLSLRLALVGNDAIKSCRDIPRGQDGFIHQQASAVTLHPEVLISQWPATAIAGNDILSSCLYSIGLVCEQAGCLSPLCFLAVSLLLLLYRGIYAMGVLTFPFNGGSYNLLANVTPKPIAAGGACLSIVAYIATSVVSAVSACSYLGQIIPLQPTLSAILLLCLVALLTLMGLKESTTVAFTIFAFHIITLALLSVCCTLLACFDGFSTLRDNLRDPLPIMTLYTTTTAFLRAAFFGFSVGMLGVSGFESSAQFVESMKPGVFVKTLRNLWVSVTVINPLLTLLAIAVLPLQEILQNRDTVLAHMARRVGGWVFGPSSPATSFLVGWMACDAFIVLSGSVLTAFVGVDGLMYQLAIDGCLPAIFTKKNRFRHTNHYIIVFSLVLSVALVVAMEGAVNTLAGCYSIAFLSVLACFGIGSAILKSSPFYGPIIKGEGLMLPWWHLILAVSLVILALAGNLMQQDGSFLSFLVYFLPTYLLCLLSINYRDHSHYWSEWWDYLTHAYSTASTTSTPRSCREERSCWVEDEEEEEEEEGYDSDSGSSLTSSGFSFVSGYRHIPTEPDVLRLVKATSSQYATPY